MVTILVWISAAVLATVATVRVLSHPRGRGTNEKMRAEEQVIVVLQTPQKKEVIQS